MSSNPNQLKSAHLETGVTKIESHEVSYTWTIEDFNFHEAKGDELESPLFSAKTNDAYKWYLSLKPNGEKGDKNEISLSLCLERRSDIRRVFAEFTSHILDSQMEEVFSRDDDEEVLCEYGPLRRDGNSRWDWGWLDFVTKNDEFKTKYLSNNELTIRVDLKFSEVTSEDSDDIEVPICDLTESIAKLYVNKEFADVVISVNDKNFPAHKNILATRSPVFAAMFKHDTKENKSNQVEIKDMKEEVVGEMLRYIYTGKCENFENFAEDLLAAADQYDLSRLKMACAETLSRTLSVENVANILVLARMHRVDVLKNKSIKFIVGRFDDVMETEGWKNVIANPQLMNEVCLALYRR